MCAGAGGLKLNEGGGSRFDLVKAQVLEERVCGEIEKREVLAENALESVGFRVASQIQRSSIT